MNNPLETLTKKQLKHRSEELHKLSKFVLSCTKLNQDHFYMLGTDIITVKRLYDAELMDRKLVDKTNWDKLDI